MIQTTAGVNVATTSIISDRLFKASQGRSQTVTNHKLQKGNVLCRFQPPI